MSDLAGHRLRHHQGHLSHLLPWLPNVTSYFLTNLLHEQRTIECEATCFLFPNFSTREEMPPPPLSPVLTNIEKNLITLVTCLTLGIIIHDQKKSLLGLEPLDFITIVEEERNYLRTQMNQENYMAGDRKGAFLQKRGNIS